MLNRKLYIMMGASIIVIGVAAFVAGRMLNGSVGSVPLGGPNGQSVFISIDEITPAPELPTTNADITGLFVERKDNTLVVQAVYFSAGVGGIAGEAPMDEDSGLKVEVVITGETKIYKDVTEFPAPVNGEVHNVQQAAEEGTLDDLHTQSSITVWGRRSGDRIIADVLFYTNPESIKK